jgi:hypothetical protein
LFELCNSLRIPFNSDISFFSNSVIAIYLTPK